MRVTVSGATGLIGSRLVERLTARGDEVTVLSRNPERVRSRRWRAAAIGWDPLHEPAPADALDGRDAVVHLAGESLSQRWSDESRERIRASRETGTGNLVAGLRTADPRPRTLVSSSAVGYYGPHGDEQLDETAPAGEDFAAQVCVAWERSALAAEELGVRVVLVRTGVVLDAEGGALAKMLPPFRLGLGGPVAGGRQYLSWIHRDDVIGLYLAALDGEQWRGPINATAPAPVTNAAFSKALGRALHRPAIAPVPRLALKALYGEMEQLVTTGQRAVPKRALELGYAYRHPDLDEALRDALG
jgi:uncharacterized protein (TIGR01777 family)